MRGSVEEERGKEGREEEDGEGEERCGIDLWPLHMFRECQGEYLYIICKYDCEVSVKLCVFIQYCIVGVWRTECSEFHPKYL